MPRIADVLERESRTVDLEPGDFERLLGRRERKQRNRRIRAGAVGVIVALAAGIILARSLTSDRIPADRPVQPRPAPAPPGTLAYILDGDVFVADPDGSNWVTILNGSCASHDGFTFWAEGSMWSPDGRYLAVRRSHCSFALEESGIGETPNWVVISDAKGNVLATFPAEGWDIRWSPDSTRVAVWEPGSLHETVGVYGVDGNRQAQIRLPHVSEGMHGGDQDPYWSVDGTSLYISGAELPLDGHPLRRIFDGSDIYSPLGDSPDGSHYVYVDHRSLKVARSDGSGSVTVLTVERGVSLGEIGFSPQGDRILFWRADGNLGNPSLWSIGVDGSDARLLVEGTIQGDWRSR
jgi:hypothetical protein